MVVYFSLSFLSPCTPPGYQARWQDQEEEQRQRLRRRPKTTALSRPVYVNWLRWPRLVPLGDKGWPDLVSSLAYVRALKAGSPQYSPCHLWPLDLGSTASCPRHLNHWITLAHRSATGRIQVARCLEQKRRSMWSCKEQRCAMLRQCHPVPLPPPCPGRWCRWCWPNNSVANIRCKQEASDIF